MDKQDNFTPYIFDPSSSNGIQSVILSKDNPNSFVIAQRIIEMTVEEVSNLTDEEIHAWTTDIISIIFYSNFYIAHQKLLIDRLTPEQIWVMKDNHLRDMYLYYGYFNQVTVLGLSKEQRLTIENVVSTINQQNSNIESLQ